MQRHHLLLSVSAVAAASLLVIGCASAPTAGDLDQQAKAMIKGSFHAQGIATLDRLDQDAVQAACSSPTGAPEAVAKQIEAAEFAQIRWPEGGRYIGDWKVGEKLAQNGRGMTWSDKSTDPGANGAQCYNCHQITKQEISYGTIGPSLYNYGKIRGVKNLSDPASAPIIQYTWGKLWDSKAYSACSTMPRFGHGKLLNEEQLRDVMALLLDPQSPVNQ
jgi:sulfur-oxidizing protein SoxX